MAKRKRLTPAKMDFLDSTSPELETKSMGFSAGAPRAPIAQVAGEAASAAALEELAGEMKRARDEGRMIQALPLAAIDAGYLQRDRIAAETAELAELKHSIRDRGQQTPIEVVAQPDGRYGLISGWRRLTALKQLHHETGEDRFDRVLSILRKPNTAAEAYLAMVEENEIRLGLSYYERARIAAKAAAQGVYLSEKLALQALFKTASRAKRSKIGAFLAIYHALDEVLRFPNAINERFGIALSHALQDDRTLGAELRTRLNHLAPETAEEELEILKTVSNTEGSVSNGAPPPASQASSSDMSEAMQPSLPAPAPALPAAKQAPMRVTVTRAGPDKLVLEGPGVTKAFEQRLAAWLDTLD